MMEIGKRLKLWRKEKGYSSAYLAKEIGVTAPTITRFEAGQTSLSAAALKNLCEKFEISIDWLLTGSVKDNIISDEIKSLINLYNQLDETHKQEIINIIKIFLNPKKSSNLKTG